ncbi:MAG TPA: DUF4386 family protein [Gaiellaceae bacterium]|nr:DUF4386 family protein [Gaiellaceae bacterium]
MIGGSGPNSFARTRYAWIGGIVFVVFLVAEAVASLAIKANQDDSASKIAGQLADHRSTLILAACLSIVYAVGFVVYLARLHEFLRSDTGQPRFLISWVLIGGVLFVSLHAVSDIAIYGMLGAKIAAYSAQHDEGLAYMLYLLTFALDSVGDIFASLFMLAAGLQVLASRAFPRWLGWLAVAASPFLFFQGFGLGGVIASFGLVLDLIGFLLLLIFVFASSILGVSRHGVLANASQ